MPFQENTFVYKQKRERKVKHSSGLVRLPPLKVSYTALKSRDEFDKRLVPSNPDDAYCMVDDFCFDDIPKDDGGGWLKRNFASPVFPTDDQGTLGKHDKSTFFKRMKSKISKLGKGKDKGEPYNLYSFDVVENFGPSENTMKKLEEAFPVVAQVRSLLGEVEVLDESIKEARLNPMHSARHLPSKQLASLAISNVDAGALRASMEQFGFPFDEVDITAVESKSLAKESEIVRSKLEDNPLVALVCLEKARESHGRYVVKLQEDLKAKEQRLDKKYKEHAHAPETVPMSEELQVHGQKLRLKRLKGQLGTQQVFKDQNDGRLRFLRSLYPNIQKDASKVRHYCMDRGLSLQALERDEYGEVAETHGFNANYLDEVMEMISHEAEIEKLEARIKDLETHVSELSLKVQSLKSPEEERLLEVEGSYQRSVKDFYEVMCPFEGRPDFLEHYSAEQLMSFYLHQTRNLKAKEIRRLAKQWLNDNEQSSSEEAVRVRKALIYLLN
ncbi:hypothetical protein [Aureibacter tunicatorum]|uniref:Muconolactone delta-isomerase n=1 Tax=Aureibacter tunicatorum TaxID=866807 RepID=A0AAE3XQY7_9BACT|nr:hypothetical protein [Aureibacter tunicatorum]MDR6240301.1 muconolactone delta-isomerase [Aureibacter tunicatorum]BDD05818.1 hypothetical protein AUTU_33010 [Aureibacter tunicatorum]